MNAMTNGTFTILVVADDDFVAATLTSALRDDGNRVVLARGEVQAAAVAKHRPPNAVLLDLETSDTAGYVAARTLRKWCRATAIVMLAGRAMDEHEAEIDMVLQRPVRSELIGGLLRYVWQRRNGMSVRCWR
jgi:CheY-like chemotaxis protein